MMIWQRNKNNQTQFSFLQMNSAALLLFAILFLSSFPAFSQCTGSCTVTSITGGDIVVRFTGAGTFTPPDGITSVQYLVVGGGGGGGGVISTTAAEAGVGGAGGGGAGGVRSGTLTVTPLQSYAITVGSGGAGGVGDISAGGTGGASIFSSITANGGGGGASVGVAATSGGSGGGGRLTASGASGTAGQGNAGGAGAGGTTGTGAGGGGGGANAAGSNGSANTGGAGGAGVSSNITGTATNYGGGGGGGGFFNAGTGLPAGGAGTGGVGGGGASPGSRGAGIAATANTGGGGGGASGGVGASPAYNGGAGGSGVVIVRYMPPPATFYSRGSGNWSEPSTWSSTGCGGSSGSSIPHAAATVNICDNHTVTLNQNASIAGLIFLGTGNTNLTHAGANTLTIGAGGVVINGSTSGANTKTWNISAGSAIVNGNLTINGGTADNRITRIQLSSGNLDINGNLTFNSSAPVRAVIEATGAANIFLSGSFNGSIIRLLSGTSSTFTYDGIGNQDVLLGRSEVSYRNLVLGGSGTKTQSAWTSGIVLGDTTVNAGVTFNNSESTTYQGSFTNHGTTNASAAHNYQGNFINTGTYVNSAGGGQSYRSNFTNSGIVSGVGLYRFNGNLAQQINGSTTFASMTLDNNSGLTINSDVTVQSQFNLTNGILTTGSNVLRVAQDWSVNRSNGWVAGNLGLWLTTGGGERTFHIGAADAYRPLGITPSLSAAGYIIASINQSSGDHPQIASSSLNAARSVNRWWSITSGGAVMNSMNVTFNYLASDIDAGTTPQNFIIQRYTGSTWDDVTEGALNATNSQGTGIAAFGQFAIAEQNTATPGCTLVSGIIGEYFNNTTLSGIPLATRVDNQIDFDWVGGAPGPAGIGADQFSIRWEGLLRVTQTGNYSFQTATDDGIRVWVNNVQLINNWTDHGNWVDTSIPITLTAGQTYSIRVEYYENGGDALMRLRWQTPGSGTYVAIPAGPTPVLGAGLYHCAVVDTCSNANLAGGIQGEYFNNMTLTGSPVGTRVDGPIDFQWLQAAPGVAGVNPNQFSVSWNGRLRTTVSGNYQFQTRSDDGVRLWVNGQLIIDQWNDHSATDHTSGNINLVAGQVYSIRLDYYENTTDAEIRLRWLVPGSTGGFVPIPAGPTPTLGAGLYHCSTAPTVTSYQVSHALTGITCEAAPVTVTAIGSNGTAIIPPANTTVVLSTTSGGGAWVGGNTYVFSGIEHTFTKYLQQTTPGTTLNVNVTDDIASGSGPLAGITFTNAGLRFYRDAASTNELQNQVAGVLNNSPTLRAIQTDTDTGACVARVSGTKTVRMAFECVNPSSCIVGQSFTVNGTAIGANANGSVTNFANVSLNFNASGVASIPLNYSDVGRVRLHANMTIPASTPDPEVTLTGTSSEFVVRPHTLRISGIETIGGVANPGGTSASGTAAQFVAAGDPFRVTVESINQAGTVTPNFGRETPSENNLVVKEVALVYPASGTLTSLAATGSFSSIAPGRFANNTVVWNQVGSLTMQPKLQDDDYMGAGSPTLQTSGTVGRFYPDHYTLENVTLTQSCTGFNYMEQPFALSYQISARGLAPTNTLLSNFNANYGTGLSITYQAENADLANGAALNSRVIETSTPTRMDGTVTVSNPSARFARASLPDGPYTSLQLGISITDNFDGRKLENMDMNATTTGACNGATCTATRLGSPLHMRYGRLRLDDAYGPESVDLPVNFITEYWTGNFFVKNTADNCTQILPSAINYPSGNISNPANLTVPLNGGSTTGAYAWSDATHIIFSGGDAGHYFLAPGTGTGTFDVGVDLTAYPWLRFDWNKNGNYNDDLGITGRYGFGQYRGHDRVIYWREKFQ